jgi:hypothetical protein
MAFCTAIFGGICNCTFYHDWNLHHASRLSALSGVSQIQWYSCASLPGNTTLVEFWAQNQD